MIFGRKEKKKKKIRSARNNFRFFTSGREALSGMSDISWGDYNDSLISSLSLLRKRSLYYAKNNPYAKQYVRMSVANIVGKSGYKLQAKPLRPDGTVDEFDAKTIENNWQKWSKKNKCDVTGRFNLTDIQKLLIEMIVTYGEGIIRFHNLGVYGTKIQVINPDALDLDMNSDPNDSNRIIMGIEIDDLGKPVAYHFNDRNFNKLGTKKQRIRVPADEILHVYLSHDADQIRGLPWMHAVIPTLKMLHGYQEAALVAARAGACKLAVYTSPDDSDFSTSYDEEGEEEEDPEIELNAGSVINLKNGAEISKYDPTYPDSVYPIFIKSCLQAIASGLGVSYNTLASDRSDVNYSSIRSGVLEEREIWKSLQQWFADNCMQMIYERWLKHSLITEELTSDKGLILPMRKIDKFKNTIWQARRWQWVDPLKDTQANVLAVEKGFKSRSSIIMEQGDDPDEVNAEFEKLKKEPEVKENAK